MRSSLEDNSYSDSKRHKRGEARGSVKRSAFEQTILLKKRDNYDSNTNINPFSQPPTRGTHFINTNEGEDFGYDQEQPVDIQMF